MKERAASTQEFTEPGVTRSRKPEGQQRDLFNLSERSSVERETVHNAKQHQSQSVSERPPQPDPMNKTRLAPPESALLRDLPFILQGLSTVNLSFESSTTLKLPATLPVPVLGLLHALAEPSLLYQGLSEFVESSDGGLVGQSLRAAIDMELRSYLGFVATLEGQIRTALKSLDTSHQRSGIGKASVTLKRCVIWTRESTMGLRLMSVIVERSKGTTNQFCLAYGTALTSHRQKGRRNH